MLSCSPYWKDSIKRIFPTYQQHHLSDSHHKQMFNRVSKKREKRRNFLNDYPIVVEWKCFYRLKITETPKSLFNFYNWAGFFFASMACQVPFVRTDQTRMWKMTKETGQINRALTNWNLMMFYPFIKFIFGCLFLLYCTIPSLAQETISPSGIVLSTDGWQPIEGVEIRDTSSDEKIQYTNEEGQFTLPKDAQFQHLRVRAKGFVNQVIPLPYPLIEPLIIYLQPTDIRLNEVVISAFGNQRKMLTTAAAIGLLDKEQLKQTNSLSLVHALNQISGVRMERRAPGSYRIAIRGSALRAPFGVRNIKVYWNDIPLTEPNGETPIHLLDVQTIGKLEVVKGPTSSIYGAGNGGAILLTGEQPQYNTNKLELQNSVGSYGLWKLNTMVDITGRKGGIQAQYNHQQLGGYRDHTAFNRASIYVNGQYYPNPKSKLAAFALLTDLAYQLPGGLTQEQYDANPRQARSGSAEKNASIDKQTLMVGTAYEHRFNRQLQVNITGYSSATQLINPFNTNYKTEQQTGIGFRGKLLYRTTIGKSLKTKWTVGGEYQQAQSDAKNFGNVNGQRDTLNFADDIRPLQYLAFVQTEWEFPKHWILTVGASYNRLQYDVERIDVDQIVTTNAIRFEPELSPRIALLKYWKKGISVYGSLSYGFSPPTLNEVRTSEGTINTDLQAERGTNYEIGVKGELMNKRLTWTSSLFALQLRDAIVTSTAASGTVLFNNAGATSNNGIECGMDYIILEQPISSISLLKVGGSYTYNHFRFKDYIKKGTDFSGNPLTGVAPHILVFHTDIKTKWGGYIHLNYNFTDAIPLNDGNTVFSQAYHLVQVKVGWERVLAKKWSLSLFGGIDNFLNQKYSLGNDLNPFGGRYFQPAPERNYYGGFKVGYMW